MTEPKRNQHQLKSNTKEKRESGQGSHGGARAKFLAGASAGSGAYREDYAEDRGPDLDEAKDVAESGREFPGAGNGD